MPTDTTVVLCTFPSTETAQECARQLVTEKLAACVNLLPQIRSIYQWQGEVQDDSEVLAIMKTQVDRFPSLRDRLVELHPYDCPEVLSLPVEAGHVPYLDWVKEGTT